MVSFPDSMACVSVNTGPIALFEFNRGFCVSFLSARWNFQPLIANSYSRLLWLFCFCFCIYSCVKCHFFLLFFLNRSVLTYFLTRRSDRKHGDGAEVTERLLTSLHKWINLTLSHACFVFAIVLMAKMCEMFPVKRKPGINLDTMSCV